jgi:hypothetical protein
MLECTPRVFYCFNDGLSLPATCPYSSSLLLQLLSLLCPSCHHPVLHQSWLIIITKISPLTPTSCPLPPSYNKWIEHLRTTSFSCLYCAKKTGHFEFCNLLTTHHSLVCTGYQKAGHFGLCIDLYESHRGHQNIYTCICDCW